MNHRDRVLAALRHEEPDRVPIDFGGIVDSTISAVSYQRLRQYLGLLPSTTRVQDVYQYTAIVEDDVRRALDIDTLPVLDMPRNWRNGALSDGSPAQFPERFRPEPRADGSQVVTNAAGTVTLKMPAGGYYFDPVFSPLASATGAQDIERYWKEIESYDRPDHLDESYEELAVQAQVLRENTDYLLVGYFGGHIFQAAQSLRGWQTFLVDLMLNKKFAAALMDHLTEANIQRFERYSATVGRYVHVIHFEDDLGMQDRPILRPELYRRAVKPYHARLFKFVRTRTDAYLLLHSDGAIAHFIPDWIEMGVDAVNPVQVSAAGMEPARLKREFGRDITFWGGGCDSQTILPFGTADQVAAEVKRRLDELAPGGGYVFGPIHNVQAEVPPENVATLFHTAREYGVYHTPAH